MITDPEDIDPDVLAAAVKMAQQDNYGTDAASVEYPSAIMSDFDVIKAQGKDPLGMMHPNFGREADAYRAAVGKNQALQAKATADQAKLMRQQMDPSYIAQQVYGSTGNIGAARVISKSTGAALFIHGQSVEMGRGGSYAIIPSGDINEVGPDGKPKRTSMSQYIQRNGVSVVPFLGGDEPAKAWRGAAAKTSELMKVLDQIEDLYKAPGFISFPGTNKNRQLEQLESGLANIVIQLKTGSISMAGVSDLEMANLENGLPAAGTNLTQTVATGIERVSKTREQVKGILMRTALMNGLVLTPLKAKAEVTAGSPTGQRSSSTPPGLNGPK